MKIFATIFALLLPIISAAQRIAVLSDLHITPGNESQHRLDMAIDEINSQNFDLVIVNGDLTNEGSDTELENVRRQLSHLARPTLVIPGNHENNWSQSATHTFPRLWGNDRFVTVLDSLVIVGINCGPYMKMGDGHVKQEDLHWLRHTLDSLVTDGRRVLSFNHYPIRSGDLDNYMQYQQLLEEYPVIAHINGHYHSWIRYDAGNIPCMMTRALKMNDGTYGYTVVEIDGPWVHIYDKPLGSDPIAKCAIGGDTRVAANVPAPSAIADAWPIEIKVDTVLADDASVFTRLAFDAESVYFGNSLGTAKAIRKSDGTERWRFDTGSSLFSRITPLKGNAVAIPGADGIYIVNASTGQQKKFLPSSEGPYVADGTLIDGAYWQGGYKRFEKRNASSGKVIWSYDSIDNYCQAAPVIDGTDVIFGAWDTYLRCLDAKTGRLRWKWDNGKSANMLGPGNVVPVVTDDRVIIVAPDRYMTAIDRRTGRQIWRDNSHRYRESLGRSIDGSRVYAKTMDGELVAVDATADRFSELFTVDMQIGYDHAPCVVAEIDGLVYVGSRRGIVTVVDPVKQEVVWQKEVGSAEINGIDIDPTDNSVWLSLIDGLIIRLTR